MTFIAWFEIVVGAMIVALWIALLVTRQVPEFTEGRKDIWFHLAAEALTAALLVAGGIFVLVSGGQATPATIAIGASMYTAVNSARFYADRRQWPVVAMFGPLAAVTAASAVSLRERAAGSTADGPRPGVPGRSRRRARHHLQHCSTPDRAGPGSPEGRGDRPSLTGDRLIPNVVWSRALRCSSDPAPCPR